MARHLIRAAISASLVLAAIAGTAVAETLEEWQRAHPNARPFSPLVDAVQRAYPDWNSDKGIQVPLSGSGPDDVSFYTPRGHIGCRIAGPPPRLVRCRSLKD